jgi:chromosome segregation ATPase
MVMGAKLLLAMTAAALLGTLVLADDKTKQNQAKKNDEAEIRAAQDKLAAAQKEVTEANKDAQDAKQHVAKVRGDLLALRRKIEDQAENSSELKKAHERVDQAKKTLEPLVTPILATVHQSPEYIAAAQQRDQLRAGLATASDRAAAAKQVAEAEAALRKLETAALEKSPAVVRAKAALAKAETQLREALAAADDVLLKDQRYAAGKRDLEKAENQAEAAVAKMVAKQRAVAAAQNKVQSEIAEERKEDARERQQQQQKKKNNNKKK